MTARDPGDDCFGLQRLECLDELGQARLVAEVELQLSGRDAGGKPREALRRRTGTLGEGRVDRCRSGTAAGAAVPGGPSGNVSVTGIIGLPLPETLGLLTAAGYVGRA